VLVSSDWIAEHLDDPNVVVAEVDENPALYDGSWTAWGNLVGVPIEKP
jgi:3-mercaptopyruvate sulfurtransferase SseA